MDKYTGIINSDLFTSYYVDGKLKCEDCVFYRREYDFNFTVIYCEKDQQNKSPENCEYYKGKEESENE